MKQKLALFMLAFICLASCKKSSTTTTTTPPVTAKSQWTVSGTTYTGNSTYWDSSVNNLVTDGSGLLFCAIIFNSRPTTNGTYSVVESDPTGGQCAIALTTNSTSYSSNYGTNSVVNVTVTGGKITATFTNVSIGQVGVGTPATVSGTLIEQ